MDLRAPGANPVLKAAALKFTSIFRRQLASKELLPVLVPALAAPSVVVHSYAANCLERVLVLRDPTTRQPRLAAADVTPSAVPLLKNLFAIIENADLVDNEYVRL